MNSINQHSLGEERGFTLTELVMVIVLIGILSAVAIPNFSGVSDDGKKAKAGAIFGSLKASYAVQSSIKKGGNVIPSDFTNGHDPACTGTFPTLTCGNAVIVLSGAATAVTAPAGWTCTVNDVTPTTTACP